MFKLIGSIILILVSVAGFFIFSNPLIKQIMDLKTEIASHDEALNNSRELENERDKLTKKYNSILPENLEKLQKLLPDNVDNIRLILEIEKIALPYGMALRDVRYDTLKKDTTTSTSATPSAPAGAPVAGAPTPGGLVSNPATPSYQAGDEYGTWNMEFSTQGTYNDFINFIKDLEVNLRIVDISSIQFSSDIGAGLNPSFADAYKYSFKIKTYWLKN